MEKVRRSDKRRGRPDGVYRVVGLVVNVAAVGLLLRFDRTVRR